MAEVKPGGTAPRPLEREDYDGDTPWVIDSAYLAHSDIAEPFGEMEDQS